MIGGETDVVKHLDPIFKTLAPGRGTIDRTPGREKARRHRRRRLSPLRPVRRRPLRQDGAQRHRVRLDGGLRRRAQHSAPRQRRQTPARDRCRNHAAAQSRALQYDFNLADITEVWRRGSVVASWLLDLTAISFTEQPNLDKFSGRVSDSGEGRWTILGRYRIGRSRTRIERRALSALHVARRRRFRRQNSFRDALPVRRAPRKEELSAPQSFRLDLARRVGVGGLATRRPAARTNTDSFMNSNNHRLQIRIPRRMSWSSSARPATLPSAS